jgi:hypothetical protein
MIKGIAEKLVNALHTAFNQKDAEAWGIVS